jgi:threonine dehydrogenase-like Zn-dependent dehydrogenase
MKQVYYNDKGEIYAKESERPVLRGKGAVVRTLCSFIGAGSEVQGVLRFRQTPGDGSKEFRMSYQSCGRVVELAPGLAGFQTGDLVACSGMGYGMHAEMSYVPRYMFAKVPDGVTPAQASSCNLGQTAIHALRRSRFQFGETVVVIGLGLVGQILGQIIRANGGIAIGTDLVDARVEMAKELGVELALNPRREDAVQAVHRYTGGVGADAVIICASAPNSSAPLEQACKMVRDKGRVVIVGLIKIEIPFAELRSKELDLLISRGRGPGTGNPQYEQEGIDYALPYVRWSENRNMQEYLRMLTLKTVQVDPLITHRFPISRAPEAFEALIRDPENTLGVLIEYGGE